MANCTSCGKGIEDWEQTYYDSFQICSDCHRRRFGSGGKALLCTGCSKRIGEQEANRSLGTTLCGDCYQKEIKRRAEWMCASCKKNIRMSEKKFKTPDGKTLCKSCMEKNSARPSASSSAFGKCSRCGKKTAEGLIVGEDTILCKDCAIEYMKDRKKMGKKEGLGERLRRVFSE